MVIGPPQLEHLVGYCARDRLTTTLSRPTTSPPMLTLPRSWMPPRLALFSDDDTGGVIAESLTTYWSRPTTLPLILTEPPMVMSPIWVVFGLWRLATTSNTMLAKASVISPDNHHPYQAMMINPINHIVTCSHLLCDISASLLDIPHSASGR